MSTVPTKADGLAGNPLSGYTPAGGVFDEMLEASGAVRPHWQRFAEALGRLGSGELGLRWENVRRMIREHGATYNVHGESESAARPRDLDLAPLLISPGEWKQIEAAVIQRATLFNRILQDLYSFQWHLRDGFLPPALVFANPSYLRPCHGLRVPGDLFMPFYSADLGRSPDGQWWVLADRTQSMLGAGYALENRTVLSRVLPEVIRQCAAQPLGGFFRVERETLRGLAPHNRDNPNVVLFTAGPHSPAYFEHAFLARQLGLPLVEGEDLTVRDRRVFVKTLEGLQPVDVIQRCVDDTLCDPLELRDDSFLGVPGLMAAARAGNVALANPLGSGLMESPAFLGFLPALCRHVLRADLLMPSVPTWWCGQREARAHVLENLDRFCLKPAFGSPNQKTHSGPALGPRERAALAEAIEARPHDFVGQEYPACSQVPVLTGPALESRPFVLQVFAVANLKEDTFVVLPGGLARLPGGSTQGGSTQGGSTQYPPASDLCLIDANASKDVWALSDAATPSPWLSPVAMPSSAATERLAAGLPSRVADNLFWLGRYAERLEDLARVLRCVAGQLMEESTGEARGAHAAIAQLLTGLNLAQIDNAAAGGLVDARMVDVRTVAVRTVAVRSTSQMVQAELMRLIYDPKAESGIKPLLRQIQHAAGIVRDRLSTDTWRILTRLQIHSRPSPANRQIEGNAPSAPMPIPLVNAQGLLAALTLDLAAFNGMAMENMTRGFGWRFLDFGRRLERAVNLLRLLRTALVNEVGLPYLLEPLLQIADSVITYRRRYYAEAQLPGVLHLLLADETNPRSLAFQLAALCDHAARLPTLPGGPGPVSPPFHDPAAPSPSPELIRLRLMQESLQAADLRAMAHARQEGVLAPLESLLAGWSNQLGGISDQLTHHYFSHTQDLSSSG